MPDVTDTPDRGLVTSAISPPFSSVRTLADVLGPALWGAEFPSSDLLGVAAAAFPRRDQDAIVHRWTPGEGEHGEYVDTAEGIFGFLTIGPGLVQVSRRNLAALERSDARRREPIPAAALALDVDQLDAEDPSESPARGVLFAWSAKSRARLVRKVVALDLNPLVSQPRVPAMVTLTLPRDWLLHCPDAAHGAQLLDRLARAWSKKWASSDLTAPDPRSAIWKREFQRRGAPHWHIWCVLPTDDTVAFIAWLSRTWNRIVYANRSPGPLRQDAQLDHFNAGTGVDSLEGMRARDPKRLAVYFLKETGASSKEYQNEPPAEWTGSVGRYWGVWKLSEATVAVALSPQDTERIWRALRRLRERSLPSELVRPERLDERTGELRRRRRPVHRRPRVKQRAGWLAVNDGPALAYRLATWVSKP